MNTLKTALLNFDPRFKLLLAAFIGTFSYLSGNDVFLLIIFIYALTILILTNNKFCKKFTFIFLSLFIITLVIGKFLDKSTLTMALRMCISFILRIIPTLMIGSYMVETTKIPVFMVALEKMKLHKGVVIALAVMLRYIPTIKGEMKKIKQSMVMRGLSFKFIELLKGPITTIEFLLIPLLMRSVNVSDDLSKSALTRGIERKEERTSIYNVKIVLMDWVILFSFILLTTLSLL